MNLRFWHGLLRVTHPDGWLQGALYMLLGAYLAGGLRSLQTPPAIRGAAVVALVIASGFAFNDWHDAVEDGLNRPWRAIPSGQIPRQAALVLACLLAAAALILGWTLPVVLLVGAAVNIVLSTCYTLFLKNTPMVGHLAIAYLNTTVILFGCMAVATPTLVVWVVGSAGFFFTLAQEIILVAVDEPGDRSAGLQTTAVRFGIGTTLVLFRIFACVPIILMLLPGLLKLASSLYLLLLIPCTLGPILVAVYFVTPTFTIERMRRSSNLILWSRALSLLPVLMLGAAR